MSFSVEPPESAKLAAVGAAPHGENTMKFIAGHTYGQGEILQRQRPPIVKRF
ncbi:MAG: hypothetical protein AAB151_00590 [Nitrospirota bacterium]